MDNINKEIIAKLRRFTKIDSWSTDYARSLTKDQWTGELERRFFFFLMTFAGKSLRWPFVNRYAWLLNSIR